MNQRVLIGTLFVMLTAATSFGQTITETFDSWHSRVVDNPRQLSPFRHTDSRVQRGAVDRQHFGGNG